MEATYQSNKYQSLIIDRMTIGLVPITIRAWPRIGLRRFIGIPHRFRILSKIHAPSKACKQSQRITDLDSTRNHVQCKKAEKISDTLVCVTILRV